MKVKKIFKRSKFFQSGWIGAGILVIISTFLAFLNYQPGTWLTGWDNLHPEFDFGLNIKRSLFAAWQEYQGLGLLGGMSHAADLVHQLVLWLASLIFKTSFLRYGFTFASLILGSLGVFFLMRRVFLRHFRPLPREFASLAGGLFYLLNLGTLQIFFVPYESFITQFAALPWLVLLTLLWLEKKQAKAWSLVLVFLLATPLAYVGTVFVVTIIVLGLFLIEYLWRFRSRKAWQKVFQYLWLVLATNAFWLFPFLYFVVGQGEVVMTSKINQYSTPDMILRNLEYATPKDIMLLRGFWFDYVDRAEDGKFDYLLGVWRDHLANPVIETIGLVLFSLVIIGVISALVRKIPWRWSALALFLLSWFMLLATNQPLGFLFDWTNNKLPLFNEMFRSLFTKWSSVAVLSYAIFFSLGSLVVWQFFRSLLGFISRPLAVLVAGVTLLGLFVSFMSPAFQGYLISPAVRREVPETYFELMEWFKTQGPATRIANFPQPTFWGWGYYDWGYRGSGFLWYGIEQPILDRAFDVWSNENEGYYREMSQAIYSQDQLLLESLLDKYQIDWLLVDHHVTVSGDQTLMFVPQLEKMLEESDRIELVQEFGKLAVYQTKLSYEAQNYLYPPREIKRIEPGYNSRNYQDLVFKTEGTNYSLNGFSADVITHQPALIYPFRDFDLRNIVSAEDLDGEIIFFGQGWDFPDSYQGQLRLEFSDASQTDAVLPARVYIKAVDNQLEVRFNYLFPKLYLDGKRLVNEDLNSIIYMPRQSLEGPYVLVINNQQFLSLSDLGAVEQLIGTTVLWTRKENTIRLYSQTQGQRLDISDQLFAQPASRCSDELAEQTYLKEVLGGELKLKGKLAVACLYTKIEDFLTSSEGLVKTSFQFRSQDNVRPIYLLINGLTSEPFNRSHTSRTVYSQDWKDFEEFTEVHLANPRELWFQLLLDAYESKKELAIEYRQVRLEEFPLVAAAVIRPSAIQLAMTELSAVEAPTKVKTVQLVVPKVDSWLTRRETPIDSRYYPVSRNCDHFNDLWFTRERGEDKGIPIFTYLAKDAGSCDFWEFRNLPQEVSYLVSFEHRFVSGKPFQICLNNAISKHCDQEFKLSSQPGWKKTTIPLPAMIKDKRGYILHLDTQSIGLVESRNDLRKIEIWPTSLGWIESLRIKNLLSDSEPGELRIIETDKKNTSLYLAEVEGEGVVVLNQAFHSGWKMFGPINKHLVINNWANGWLIQEQKAKSKKQRLVIVFWPQYLEFLGFALMLGAGTKWFFSSYRQTFPEKRG